MAIHYVADYRDSQYLSSLYVAQNRVNAAAEKRRRDVHDGSVANKLLLGWCLWVFVGVAVGSAL